MTMRGRKAAVEAETTVVAGNFGKRPEPPEDFNERQAEIWRATVASEAPDLFDTYAIRSMLGDYCRHRESLDGLNLVIGEFDVEWLKGREGAQRYKDLLKMRDAETTAAARLARSMRLTNQSRYTPQRAATVSANSKSGNKLPWEF